jgi:hypothetical protein
MTGERKAVLCLSHGYMYCRKNEEVDVASRKESLGRSYLVAGSRY